MSYSQNTPEESNFYKERFYCLAFERSFNEEGMKNILPFRRNGKEVFPANFAASALVSSNVTRRGESGGVTASTEDMLEIDVDRDMLATDALEMLEAIEASDGNRHRDGFGKATPHGGLPLLNASLMSETSASGRARTGSGPR